jgi:hypothetical protein
MGVEKMRIKVTVYSHDLTRARSLRNEVTTIDPHGPELFLAKNKTYWTDFSRAKHIKVDSDAK